MSRAAVCEALSLPPTADGAAYYKRALADGWTLLVLDTTDLSIHGGWPEGSAQDAAARAYLADHEGEDRMQRYNGGVGAVQMSWLNAELAAAEQPALCRN